MAYGLKTMPKYIESVRKLGTDNLDVFESKNKEYGNAFQDSIKKYGLIAALTRMNDKFKRIETLILNDDKPSHESLKDSLLDLSNYCLMTAHEVDHD